MDIKKLREPLKIKDIDFRVQSVNNGGYAVILAYKSARVDMNRLDDVVGCLNWKREHTNNNRNCIVSIYNKETKEWVSKEDVGTESNTEAFKGLASDSFKRACFNFGIGRELYSYPVISVKLRGDEVTEKNGKKAVSWGFKLKQWRWLSQFKNGDISFLAAKDENGTVRFKWGVFDVEAKQEESLADGGEKVLIDDNKSINSSDTKEEENVKGVLKKKYEPIEDDGTVNNEDLTQNERFALANTYKELYGRNPSSVMKIENLRKKVKEELDRVKSVDTESSPKTEIETKKIADVTSKPKDVEGFVEDVTPKPKEEEEEDKGIYGGKMSEDAGLIDTFTDKEEFKNWAIETMGKWDGIATEEHIKEFKDLCNDKFQKLN